MNTRQFLDAYSEEQLRRFREEFSRQADRFKRGNVWYPVVLFVAFVFFFGPLPIAIRFWPWWACALLVAGHVAIRGAGTWYYRRLVCPACRKQISRWIATHHCPDCGSDRVNRTDGPKHIKCDACSLPLSRASNGWRYQVHHCTHCGVRLSEEGISPNTLW